MTARRPGLVALAVLAAAVGCTRNQTRRDPLRRQAVPAIAPLNSTEPVAAANPNQAFEVPTPPAPPPLPQVAANQTRPVSRAQAEPKPVEATPVKLPEVVAVEPPSPAAAPVVLEAPTPPTTPVSAQVIPEPPPAPPAPATAPPVDRAKQLIDAANQRYATVTDYECRLIKREVVNGRPMPQDEILYRFRKQPLSVGMKILSEAGQGREVIFVKGRDEGAMHVVTGKGDSRLVGVGYKTTVDPDGRDAQSKSRYRVYQAGFGRTLQGLESAAQRGFQIQSAGLVQRPEWPYPLECVTVTATGPGDPTLPPGCKRSIFFDPKPESPSHALPVLTEMRDAGGQEIEYYSFDRFKLPAGLTDADFDPARMGKRR